MLCYSHSTEKHSDAQGRLSDLAKMYSGKVNSLLTSFFTKMYFSPIKSTNQKIKKKKKDWNGKCIKKSTAQTLLLGYVMMVFTADTVNHHYVPLFTEWT